ncbi:MAG: hypothetical protein E7469_08155 [Ruminococcaceae bacterium]|nr:hypothetical protein [Oscillospiraceae bacterium]
MEQTFRFGSYLVIPLKFEGDHSAVAAGLEPQPMTTMDLTENVKAMLGGADETAIGRCVRVPAQLLRRRLTADDDTPLAVKDGKGVWPMEICPSFLYIFRTQVAFLCLGIRCDHIQALNSLYSPGCARSDGVVVQGEQTLDLEGQLTELLHTWGLSPFFDGGARLLLDAFTVSIAVSPTYFPTTELMQRLSFCLHQMVPLDSTLQDGSEEDLSYVYAVKNEDYDAYRWGCCVASQRLSYVMANPALDLTGEMADLAADALPLAILMLHQKFTCLRFTQLMARRKRLSARRLYRLQQLLLDFQAYGTVATANVSRWHNIKQIYHHLVTVNDISAAVEDVSTKLSILAAQQSALEDRRAARVGNIITVFGLISILDSALSIAQSLQSGDPLLYECTKLTVILLTVLLLLAAVRRK